MEAIVLKKVAAFEKRLDDLHTVAVYNNNILNEILVLMKENSK